MLKFNLSAEEKKRFYKLLIFALGFIVLDQAVKLLVKLNMGLDEEIHVIGDFFKIHFTENPGAAFGMTFSTLFPSLSPETAKLILSLFSVLAVPMIIYFLVRTTRHRSALPWFVALILAGALGNIIDRMFYGMWFAEMNDYEGGFMFGRVVDMFYCDFGWVYFPNWMPLIGGKGYQMFPIFNVADAAITVGILAILVFQGRFFRTHYQKIQSEWLSLAGSGQEIFFPPGKKVLHSLEEARAFLRVLLEEDDEKMAALLEFEEKWGTSMGEDQQVMLAIRRLIGERGEIRGFVEDKEIKWGKGVEIVRDESIPEEQSKFQIGPGTD